MVAPPPLMVRDLGPNMMLRGYTPVKNIVVSHGGVVRVLGNARFQSGRNFVLFGNREPLAQVEGTTEGLEITLPFGTQLRRSNSGDLLGSTVTQLYEQRRFGLGPRRDIGITDSSSIE
jgi:hypothetical protein